MLDSSSDFGPKTATLRRFTRHEYDRMVDAGIFGEDDHIELLNGLVTNMTPQGEPHAFSVRRLNRILVLLCGNDADVGPQLSFAASDDSEPEPDLAVTPVVTTTDDHPATAYLVVEVANTSLHHDRAVKSPIYARAAVPEYWIVDVQRRHIEVYSEPMGDHYGTARVARIGDTIELVALPGRRVAVADVFPA